MKKSELRKIIKEEIDSKYLEIKFANIKKELDVIIRWFNKGDFEKAKDYIEDQIDNLQGILKRIKDK